MAERPGASTAAAAQAPAAALGADAAAVARLIELLAERADAARALVAAITADDGARAADAQRRIGEAGAALGPLQRALAPALPGLSSETLASIRQRAADIHAADTAVNVALATAGAAALPLWLLGRGQPSEAALAALLAPPWDNHRDLVGLVGEGAFALGQALQARGQSRVLVCDPSAPETPVEMEGVSASLWNVHSQQALETVVSHMAWPLPAQLRVAEVAPRPAWRGEELRTCLAEALNFAGIGQLQILEEARFFALKASRNLAAVARTPSIASLRGALAGLPAVVVSAGPSLDKNIAELAKLQGRVVVVAINQTVASLRRAGIRADIVVVVDPLNVSYHFEGTQPGDIGTLMLGAGVDPAIFRVPCDRVVTFSASPLVERWIYDFVGEDAAVGSGGTVSTGAIKVCAWLGCDPIISIGRDLALAGRQYYASSSADGGQDVAVTADGGKISFADYSRKLRLAEGGGDRAGVQAMLDSQVYQLTEVPGFYGPPVTTTDLFVYEMGQLRRTTEALADSTRLINATEGGAFLAGMAHMSLAEAGARHALCPVEVDRRIAERLAAAPLGADRTRRMADALAALSRDLDRMTRVAREARDLAGVAGDRAATRRERLGAELAELSRSRPFLSVLVQNATRTIVKKGGPGFASQSEADAAERALYAAIADLAENLGPAVGAAVLDLRAS